MKKYTSISEKKNCKPFEKNFISRLSEKRERGGKKSLRTVKEDSSDGFSPQENFKYVRMIDKRSKKVMDVKIEILHQDFRDKREVIPPVLLCQRITNSID